MTNKEIVEMCKSKGLNYSYMTIFRIGKKEGFLVKEENSKKLKFDESKFQEWLNSMTVEIPEDCMYISDAVTKYNINYQVFKYYFISNNIEMKEGGYRKQGRRYVRKSDIESAVKNYNKNIANRRKND